MKIRFLALAILLIMPFGMQAQSAPPQNRLVRVAIKNLKSSPIYEKLVGEALRDSGYSPVFETLQPARGLNLIKSGKIDVLIPEIRANVDPKARGSDYAPIDLFKVDWVFYYRAGQSLDFAALRRGDQGKLVIEAEPSIFEGIKLRCTPTYDYAASFLKLSKGRIDGLFVPPFTGDAMLRASGIKNVRRMKWQTDRVTLSLKKGGIDSPWGKSLLAGIERLKKNGRYQVLMGDLISGSTYIEWQP